MEKPKGSSLQLVEVLSKKVNLQDRWVGEGVFEAKSFLLLCLY